MGAPFGNANRADQYRIKRTLETCLEKRSKKDGIDALEAACNSLIDRSFSSLPDFKELADRLDGKPTQSIDATVKGNLTAVLGSLGRPSERTEDDSSVA